MFIRWKKGKHQDAAILVKSVRVNGKPHQEFVATLCSVKKDKPNALIAWAHAEMKLQELNLTEQERAHVSQSLEKTIPRPPTEAIEKEKCTIAGLLAMITSRQAPVVPNMPPMRTVFGTTDGGVEITWSVNPKQGGKYLEYMASLVLDAQTIELGTIEKGDLAKPKWNSDFWFSVHSALCLANVGYETYEKTLQTLETWVERLRGDEFVKAMQWRQYSDLDCVQKEKRAIFRRIARLDKKEHDLLDVRNRGRVFLTEIQRSVPRTQI